MSRTPLGPLDAMFLLLDSTDTPMHVGALMPFEPGGPTDPEHLRQLYQQLRTAPVCSPWNRRLATHHLKHSPVHWWVEDDDIDLEYHVRRSALPSPGDERELGVMVARLHSNPLDLSRPPWEMHVIEGLADGRFAIYVKVHHALVDGVSAMKILARSLSRSADELDTPVFFSTPPPPAARPDPDEGGSVVEALPGLLAAASDRAAEGAGALLRLGRALGRAATSPARDTALVGSMQAPRSILNERITRQRRFATQQYSVERLKVLAHRTGTTLNDVVLSICGGGLRTYLDELDALPERGLIGFLPVNVRTSDDPGGGNAVGAVLATLGTDVADPVQRLKVVHASTTEAKGQLAGMDQTTAMAYSAALLGPAALQAAAAFTGLPVPGTTFNVCVSNVPGPREPLYFRGARLQAVYPLSIPTHGMALNITVESYADTLNVGFIGCRDTLPHLQRLAVHTGAALAELEAALGSGHAARRTD